MIRKLGTSLLRMPMTMLLLLDDTGGHGIVIHGCLPDHLSHRRWRQAVNLPYLCREPPMPKHPWQDPANMALTRSHHVDNQNATSDTPDHKYHASDYFCCPQSCTSQFAK